MKKISLLIALVAVVCGNAFAQFSYDFNDCTAGAKIAQTLGDPWTTWGNNPGSAEDGVFAEMGGSMAGKFTYGNDQIIKLGNKTNGKYTISYDLYIPTGKDAYGNILHLFNGSGSEWAADFFFKNAQNGTSIKTGGNTTNFECPFDAWFNVKFDIDLDNDQATFYVANTAVVTWQFSLQVEGGAGTRQLAAMDFWPPTSNAVSEFYIDNVSFVVVGGETSPTFSVSPSEIHETLGADDMKTVDVEIQNTGNSIGDWIGWMDFGHGGEGSQTVELKYHNGQIGNGIGSNNNGFTRELGMRLPASSYAGASMGMKIVSAKYFVPEQYKSSNDTYIFRIYGQGMNGQPGEALAEKSITSAALNTWVEATFDQPVYMTGQAYWVTVQLEQAAGEFPMAMDGGNYGENQDGNWLSTAGSNFMHCYNAGNFEGAWLISANCQGELIPGSWVSMNKIEGSVLAGNSEKITLNLSTLNLVQETYSATLIINTNDEEHPHFEIPVTLYADINAIADNENQLASIYPNPSEGTIVLQGENLNSVAVYNVTGQLVRIIQLNDVTNRIDLNVETGVYFLNVYDNNGESSVSRLVVK